MPVESITITPARLTLRRAARDAVIDVLTTAGGPVTGTIDPPGRRPVPLTFKLQADGLTWRATPSFDLSSPAGLWRVRVTEGRVATSAGLHVVDPRQRGRVRFQDLAVQPQQVVQGDTTTVTGRLELQDARGVWRPFGGQPVIISFRRRGRRLWRTIGSAETRRRDGGFTTEVGIEGNGRLRAEFRGSGAPVLTGEVDVIIIGLGGSFRVLRRPPTAATFNGKACLLHVVTVTHKPDGLPAGGGRATIWVRSGGWRVAEHPGGGTARAPVSNGTAKVRSTPGGSSWKAEYTPPR
ncbi:hypothetical protein [Nonomuraea zeae]|uniref:Uncharacterized protein n=1 Tax=Nonomuraea zeae TaxID=1642303 RepID=A0A5S4G890_9ACTN|nr:hypothetical protein [Nonomuraea zeae]TMR29072.1 hypothetical protein ETD85_33710 [Nonomuraea zeae]